MEDFFKIKNNLARTFTTWSTGLLSITLVLSALIILFIALLPDHALLKALALAYVLLP